MCSSKKVALYARVSTRKQKNEDTIENQLRELYKFVKTHGYKIHQTYVDNGFSGTTDERPQLRKLMKDAQEKLFSAVLVWRFDRFGRSLIHLVSSLERFKELSIDFISIKENVDTSSTIGKVFFGMIALMAEFERETIRERVIAGMRRRKEDGKNFGKKPKQYNAWNIYDLKDQGFSLRKLGIISGLSKSRISQLIHEKNVVAILSKNGKTIREIAIELKIQEQRVISIVDYFQSKVRLIKCPVSSRQFKYLLS
ncbi:MAG: recombinase family protein [Planctomycetes bacterium]|nr:recombinase family protein [Planctomycetota bacterium]